MNSSHATVVDVPRSKGALKRMGFEVAYNGGDVLAKRIEGTYGFQVIVHLVTKDINPEPLHRAKYDITLPHQCDSWRVLKAEEDVAAAFELTRAFTKEAQAAGNWLIRATGAVVYREPITGRDSIWYEGE